MLSLIFGGILKRATDALWALLGIIRRYPLETVIMALCAALAWTWHGKQTAQHNLATCQAARKADRQAYVDAEAEASAKAIAALQAQEAHYQTKAKEADNAYSLDLAAAHTAAGRYAAGHRVPASAVNRSPGPANAAAPDSSASVSSGATAQDFVAISDADFNACTGAVIYAQASYEWAQGLNDR